MIGVIHLKRPCRKADVVLRYDDSDTERTEDAQKNDDRAGDENRLREVFLRIIHVRHVHCGHFHAGNRHHHAGQQHDLIDVVEIRHQCACRERN